MLRNSLGFVGELFGPTIYTAGPILEGKLPTSPFMPVIKTAKAAAQAVAKLTGLSFFWIPMWK